VGEYNKIARVYHRKSLDVSFEADVAARASRRRVNFFATFFAIAK